MSRKYVVSPPVGTSVEKASALRQKVAAFFEVSTGDVLVLPGATLTVVDVPAGAVAARRLSEGGTRADADLDRRAG